MIGVYDYTVNYEPETRRTEVYDDVKKETNECKRGDSF